MVEGRQWKSVLPYGPYGSGRTLPNASVSNLVCKCCNIIGSVFIQYSEYVAMLL